MVDQGGTLRTVRTKTPLTFGKNGDTTVVSAKVPHGNGTFGWHKGLPQPRIQGNKVVYPDTVSPGVDLVTTALANGFLQSVVIRQRPTSPITIKMPLTLPQGMSYGKSKSGATRLLSADGKPASADIVARAVDAAAERSPEEGHITEVATSVETAGDDNVLVLKPDLKFLTDPAVTYPVTLDAPGEWVGAGMPEDAWVNKNNPTLNHLTDGWLRAGTTKTSADVARVYLRYVVNGTDLDGARIENADVIMWNYRSGADPEVYPKFCGTELSYGTVMRKLTTAWDPATLSWNNQPSWTSSGQAPIKGAYSDTEGCSGGGELWYSIEPIVQGWASGEPDHGLVLMSALETTAINWRQYYSEEGGPWDRNQPDHAPVLFVLYEPATVEEIGIAYERDGLPDDSLPTYEELLANQVPLSSTAPELTPITLEEAAQRQQESDQTEEVDPETLPDESPADPPAEPDTTPPAIIATTPLENATSVKPATPILAFFSEAVSDAQIVVKDAEGAAIAGSASLNPGGESLDFTPEQPLPGDNTFTAEVTGAIDAAGNVMPPYSWTFSTGQSDSAAPIVTGTTPAANAADAPLDGAIKVTFNEQVSDVQITVKDSSDAVVQGLPTGGPNNDEWTFTPASRLAAQKVYRVEVSGAKDAAGNVMSPYNWSFTTAANTQQPIPGLVAAYGMNEGSGTGVIDSSGQNNTGTGSGTAWVNGKYGKALSFNGSSSMVTVAHAASLRLTTGMTLSAWVNPATVTGTPWKSVVTKELNGEGASYALYAANGDALPSGWVQTDPVTPLTAEGTSPLPVNSWSHLALTYDGATLRMFVNGQQVDQTPLNAELYDDGSPLRIGGNAVWSEYFSGLIDEVRVYNRAQTTAEIQTDMATPIGQAAPPDSQAPTAPGSLAATGAPGSAQLTWTASTDNVRVDGYRIHRSTTPGFTPSAANQVGSSPTTTFTDAGLAAGTYYYRVRAVDAAGNLSPFSNEVSATVTALPTNPGLVAAYGMNEGTGTTVGDSSGQNNTGAATDTTWTTTGKHGKALSFNGTTSWVTVPHAESLRMTDTLTLSAWVRPTAADGYRTVLMKENDYDGSYTLYSSSGASLPMGSVELADAPRGVRGDDPLPLNQWSHLALTYDGSIATLYVNGAPVDQYPFTGELVDHGGVLRLGGNSVWEDEFYSGLIDEVRIYNRAQTATEIQTDMNTPVGAAAAAQQRRMDATADATPTINKLTIEGTRTVDGITVASTLTPRLTTWLSNGRKDEAKVEVEIAGKPTKSFKAGKVIRDEHLVWSGQATAKPDDSQVALQVPKGKLRDGDKVRWRARAIAAGVTGAWTTWHSLSVQDLATADQPRADQVETTAAPSGPTPTLPTNRLDFQKCWANKKSNSKAAYPHGWVRDSYNWCSVRTVGKARTQKVREWCGCIGSGGWKTTMKVKAKLEFLFSVAGHTYAGGMRGFPYAEIDQNNGNINSRTISMWARVDDIHVTGPLGAATFPETTDLTVNIAGGAPSGQHCALSKGGARKSTIAQWRDPNSRQQYFEFVSNKSASTGPHRLSVCTFTPILALGWQAPVPSPFIKTKMVDMPVRCDTSEELATYYGGCVYSEFTPTFQTPLVYGWNGNDPIMNESTDLIRRALEEPKETYPHKTDEPKVIPGARGVAPLHRSSSSSRDTQNRTQSVKYCAQMLAELGEPSPKNKDCDEYPFAATHEGSAGATTNRNVAVDFIAHDHNRSVGSKLRAFWQAYRVLGSDAVNGQDMVHTFESFFVKTPN
ncbi:LamG-like jellyroll fold domain-containing protein [Nonomuraea purpurea]|uniref:LamG-like jellyroll fold domain-containing protein n=1 Tax=Nonomuraea purpurea TaxID=1849276 RepID=A0ABV8FWK6_9ACTN